MSGGILESAELARLTLERDTALAGARYLRGERDQLLAEIARLRVERDGHKRDNLWLVAELAALAKVNP